MTKWSDLGHAEKIALIKKHGQSGTATLTGTTSSAVGGFMSRNAKVLGIKRADPEASRGGGRGRGFSTYSEEALTAKWQPKPRPQPAPEAPRIGQPPLITDANRPKVIQLYKEGAKIALIAVELGVSEKTIKNEVSRLIKAKVLTTRRPNIGGKILFRLQLTPDDDKMVYNGAKRRGSTKASYIRYLIRRDNP